MDLDLGAGLVVAGQAVGIALRVARFAVDDALELVLSSDRETNRNSLGTEFGVDFLNASEEVSADTVHLVHVHDLRNAVLVRLTPNSL